MLIILWTTQSSWTVQVSTALLEHFQPPLAVFRICVNSMSVYPL